MILYATASAFSSTSWNSVQNIWMACVFLLEAAVFESSYTSSTGMSEIKCVLCGPHVSTYVASCARHVRT